MIAKYISSTFIETRHPRMLNVNGTCYFPPIPEQVLIDHDGWLPVVSAEPLEPREGFRVETWYTKTDDAIVEHLEYVAIPPEPIMISKAKVEAAVESMGKEAEFIDWLWSNPTYAGAWYRGGDSIAYDPQDNESDLASLISALGVAQEDVASLIAQVSENQQVEDDEVASCSFQDAREGE